MTVPPLFCLGVTVDRPSGALGDGRSPSASRLNNAPVAGYEGDVGSKTTMRLFYPESAHFNPKVENNPDTLLVLVAFKAMDFHWIETILSDKKRVGGGTGGRVEAWGWGHCPSQDCQFHDVCSADLEPVKGRRALSLLQGF